MEKQRKFSIYLQQKGKRNQYLRLIPMDHTKEENFKDFFL